MFIYDMMANILESIECEDENRHKFQIDVGKRPSNQQKNHLAAPYLRKMIDVVSILTRYMIYY